MEERLGYCNDDIIFLEAVFVG